MPLRARPGRGQSQNLMRDEEQGLFEGAQASSKYLEEWYAKFTVGHTCRYVAKVVGVRFLCYCCWSLLCAKLAHEYPEQLKRLEADFALKVLTFLVGLLISLTLKESLDRYKNCLSALIDFRDEFRSFWYFAQLPVLRKPAHRLLIDVHMVCYAVSLVRFLLKKANIKTGRVFTMVQPEFRRCVLFQDEGTYGTVCSNPAYSELLLVSWLRTMGQMDSELRRRFQWARQKLHLLLTAQRVKSPRTSVHLLNLVVHIFLVAIPVCSTRLATRLSTPIISVAFFALLSLAEELEDPFGVDEHDLPWPILLGTISHCTLRGVNREVLDKSIAFFNHGCVTSRWDPEVAKEIFGDNVVIPSTKDGDHYGHVDTKAHSTAQAPSAAHSAKGKHKIAFDSGVVDLSVYLTEHQLKRLDVVGRALLGYKNMAGKGAPDDDAGLSSDGEDRSRESFSDDGDDDEEDDDAL